MSDTTDEQHWSRLRALQDSGSVNMFMNVKRGLDENGWEDTWEWLIEDDDRIETYLDGEWVERNK